MKYLTQVELMVDDSAILRWHQEKSEPHHLIRNVRRSLWSDSEKKKDA